MQARDTTGMSMDHHQAQSTKAAERYLLGEMSEPERFDFESHYFQCEECGGDVRAVHALAKGMKAAFAEESEPVPVRSTPPAREPRSGWFAWLAPGALAPSAVALGLAVVAAYQGWVVIPELRWQTGSRAMAPIALRAAARGSEQILEMRRDQPFTLVSLDVNNADPGAPLTYEIIAPGGEKRISNATQAPPAGSPLIVVLQNTDFLQLGSWNLVLRDAKGTEISHYPFSIQIK